MGRNKVVNPAQSPPADPPSVAPPDVSAMEPPKQAETVSTENTVVPADVDELVSQDPDIMLPAILGPIPEPHKETPIVDVPMVTATPIPPTKPVLKFKPPKSKPKADAQVPPANGDANKELEALLSPVAESKATATAVKDAVADADLLLGELVDEIGVDTKPRGTPSWSSKKKGKDRADGQARRLVPESTSRQGSPAVPHIPPAKSVSKKVSSSNASKTRDPMADMHPIDVKKCNEIVKNLTDIKTLPEVGWFLLPVDPIASGCPT